MYITITIVIIIVVIIIIMHLNMTLVYPEILERRPLLTKLGEMPVFHVPDSTSSSAGRT